MNLAVGWNVLLDLVEVIFVVVVVIGVIVLMLLVSNRYFDSVVKSLFLYVFFMVFHCYSV